MIQAPPTCRIPYDWIADFSQCLYDWQALFAGILALGAAGATILQIRAQISQADDHHANQINRRHQAVRATISLTVANFTSYIDDLTAYFAYCHSLGDRPEGPEAFKSNAETFNPDFPYNAAQQMRDFVETLTDQNSVKHIAELISTLQMLDAKTLKSSKQLDASKASNIENIILCGKAKLLNEKIFNYARFVDEEDFAVFPAEDFQKIWNEIKSYSHKLMFIRQDSDVFLASISDAIDQKICDGKNPWLEKMNP